ncbi:MAG: MerR family transcriptional regulator [Desulfuromonadaceae bacterium]|nr:MerR family transcriptional regulator [Desulfuromonadaceae bacterium]
MYKITELARHVGLSRSTLLYYDRIGLLSPSGRSGAGYRLYSTNDRDSLATICSFRQAGLTMDDIRRILTMEEDTNGKVLQRRMRELGEEIRTLQTQQHLLGKMLKVQSLGELPVAIDKQAWIDMLRAAGMDEAAMRKWHIEFERRAPEAHQQFLLSLGISEDEVQFIRKKSAEAASV